MERAAKGDVLRKLDSVLSEHDFIVHSRFTELTYRDDGTVTGTIGIMDMSGQYDPDMLRQVLAKRAKVQCNKIERGNNWWVCYF